MNYSWKVLLPLFIGTVAMIVMLQIQGKDLSTPQTPLSIVNLELAKTPEEAQAVLAAWKPDASSNLIAVAHTNVLLDFIFIPFYSLFLFAACRKIRYHSTKWQKMTGKNFAYGALIAGGFDIVENTFMLQTLHNNYGLFSTFITFVCAAAKFLLAGMALLYVLLGIKRLFRSRRY